MESLPQGNNKVESVVLYCNQPTKKFWFCFFGSCFLIYLATIFTFYLTTNFSVSQQQSVSQSSQSQSVGNGDVHTRVISIGQQHNFTLSPALLKSAVIPGKATTNEHKLTRRLMLGKTISVGIIGGSFSTFVVNDAHAGIHVWHFLLKRFLEINFNSTVDVYNLAIGGVNIKFDIICEKFDKKQQLDILFLDYNPNLGLDENHFKIFELLLRKNILRFPSTVVCLVQMMLPRNPNFAHWHFNFHSNAENGLNSLAQYYGIHTISLRNSLYHYQDRNMTGFSDDIRSDHCHFNKIGHIYVADMLVYWMQDLLNYCDSGVSCLSPPYFPPPMYEKNDNFPVDLICARGQALVSNKNFVVTGSWSLRADDHASIKFGLIGETNMLLSISIGYYGFENVTLLLGYLKTYEKVGSAQISCKGACLCSSVILNGLGKAKVSVTEFSNIDITYTSQGNCSINLKVLEVRFKLTEVIVTSYLPEVMRLS